jgi:hypothetical protein
MSEGGQPCVAGLYGGHGTHSAQQRGQQPRALLMYRICVGRRLSLV